MYLPPGKTEAEVLAAIKKTVDILAPSFAVGYYDIDDMKQEATWEAIRVLNKGKYDPDRPLENFLYVAIRRRLLNFQRDHVRRNDPPCKSCHEGKRCTEGSFCKKYAKWLKTNNAKASAISPLGLNHISDERDRNPSGGEQEVELNELLDKIDRELPVELRGYYLQMRDGLKIPKVKRLEVEKAVKLILGDAISG